MGTAKRRRILVLQLSQECFATWQKPEADIFSNLPGLQPCRKMALVENSSQLEPLSYVNKRMIPVGAEHCKR